MSRNIRPLGTRVVLEPESVPTTTQGGIILPEQAVEKSYVGTVRAVGDAWPAWLPEHLRPIGLTQGRKVVYPRFEGMAHELVDEDGVDVVIFDAKDLVALCGDGGREDIAPLWDYLVIKRDEAPTVIGSIIIPEDQRPLSHWGTVLQAGPGRIDDEQFHPTVVRPGMRVLVHSMLGEIYWLGPDAKGPHWLIIRERDVIAYEEPDARDDELAGSC